MWRIFNKIKKTSQQAISVNVYYFIVHIKKDIKSRKILYSHVHFFPLSLSIHYATTTNIKVFNILIIPLSDALHNEYVYTTLPRLSGSFSSSFTYIELHDKSASLTKLSNYDKN